MTGFGRTEVTLPDKKVTVEIKSLNSKNSDIYLKLPMIYREKEAGIRKLISEKLERGKIECSLYVELNEGISSSTLNEELIKDFYTRLKSISGELGIKEDEPLLSAILRLPEALKTTKTEPGEEEWAGIISGLEEALEELDRFRIQEGQAMKEDIEKRTSLILKSLEKVEPFEKQRIQKLRDKFNQGLNELKLSEDCDKNRFEQEIIYYIEKMDFTEEKIRLKNHCLFFTETMNQPVSNGKKLVFISQEMGREINTLGSKAMDADIQKLVVEMKDELEKIKELLLNVL
mgnify:CR=1 FL=1